MDIIRKYPLDVSGRSPDNLILQEPHDLVETPTSEYRVLIPNYGGFYTESLRVYDDAFNPLPEADYISTYLFEDATELTGFEVCGAIVIKNPNVSKRVYIDVQVVGGNYAMSTDALAQVLEVLDNDNRPVDWKAIIGKPLTYPVGGHLHALWELYGFEYMVVQLERITQAILVGNQSTMDELRDYAYALYLDAKAYTDALDDRFQDHKNDFTNPHRVTKAQVGLGLVENYRIATNNEIEAGTSTSLYLTVAGVVHAIDYHLGRDFRSHANNTSNPHNVTKAQTGLGNVENYAISTTSQAEVGTTNDRYMTPLRTAEAITFQIGNAFDTHVADYTNPHRVTKAQVGLGSVLNYGVASQAEAEAGSLNNHYMTPLRVKQAIDVQAISKLNAHAALTNNPHSVTKSQVGLSNVENYTIASQSEAEAGTRNDRYMTPLRTKQAITEQAGSLLDTHIRDNSNPHGVTKSQVGLGSVANYSIASVSEARDGTVNTKYMTPLRTADAISVQALAILNTHASRTNNPHNVTKSQVGLGSVENYGIASWTDMQNGTRNDRYVTPQRYREGFAAAWEWFATDGFTIPKSNDRCRISFPAGRNSNDPGYIEHIDIPNSIGQPGGTGTSYFRFCISDDLDNPYNDTDRFQFGATGSGGFGSWVEIDRNRLLARSDVYVGGTVNANDYYFRSDMRFKEVLGGIENPLEKVTTLNGFDYRLTTNGELYTGLSAQEVQSVLPNSVRTAKDENNEDYLTINLAGPVALLVEVNKQLIERDQEKDAKILSLENRIKKLESIYG